MDRTELKEMGARLREARIAAGFATRDDAETALHLSARALEAYEQGIRLPEEATFRDMADLYGTHPALLRYGAQSLALGANQVASRLLSEAAERLASTARLLEEAPRDPRDVAADRPTPSEAAAATPAPAGRPRSRHGLPKRG